MFIVKYMKALNGQFILSIKCFLFFVIFFTVALIFGCKSKNSNTSLMNMTYIDSVDIERERVGDIRLTVLKDSLGQDSLLLIFNRAYSTISLLDTGKNMSIMPMNQPMPKEDIFFRLSGAYHDGSYLYMLNDYRIVIYKGLFDKYIKSVWFEQGYAAGYINFRNNFMVSNGNTYLTALRDYNYSDKLQRGQFLDSPLVAKLSIGADSIKKVRYLPIQYPRSQRFQNYPYFYPIYYLFDSTGENYAYTFAFWDSIGIVANGTKNIVPIDRNWQHSAKPGNDGESLDLVAFYVVNGGNNRIVKFNDQILLIQTVKNGSTIDKNGELITFFSAPRRLLIINLKTLRMHDVAYALPPNCNPDLTIVFKNRLYLFSETDDFKTRMYAVDFK